MTSRLLSRRLCLIIIVTTGLLAAPLTTGINIRNASAQSESEIEDYETARRIYEIDLEYYEWCINQKQAAQGTFLEALTDALDCGERPIPPAGVSRPLNETRTGPITESLEDLFGGGNQTDGRISTANETRTGPILSNQTTDGPLDVITDPLQDLFGGGNQTVVSGNMTTGARSSNMTTDGPLDVITDPLQDLFGGGNQTDGRISTANETIGNITRPDITTPPSNVSDNATTPVTGLQEGGLRVEFDTFIVPGSSSEFGTYEPHQSNTFSADETIEWYVELAGITNQPSVDEIGNTQYLTDVSGTFSITDEEGNTRESFTEEDLGFVGAETSDTQVSQMSLVFTYTPGLPPELDAGNYKMTFTITDNLSGQSVNLVRDIIIVGGGPGGIEGGMGGGGAGGVTGTTTTTTTPPGESIGEGSSGNGGSGSQYSTTPTTATNNATGELAGLPGETTSNNTLLQSAQPAENASAATTEQKIYENPEWGISMQYPSDWTASTVGLIDYADLIAFYPPPQNLSDSIPARLKLSVTTYGQNLSLSEYTNFVWTTLNESEQVNVKNSGEVTIAGYPGYIVIIADQPLQNTTTLTFNNMGIWTTIGNKVYLIAYEGQEPKFSQHLPEVNQMLESLTIANSNNNTMTNTLGGGG